MELRDEVLAWTYELLADTPAAVEMSAKVGRTPAVGSQERGHLNGVLRRGDRGDLLLPLEAAPFRQAATRSSVNTETT